MGNFLQVVGVVWALIVLTQITGGIANLFGMDWLLGRYLIEVFGLVSEPCCSPYPD